MSVTRIVAVALMGWWNDITPAQSLIRTQPDADEWEQARRVVAALIESGLIGKDQT